MERNHRYMPEEKLNILTVLRRDDETREAALDLMTTAQMKAANGADILIGHLDKLFTKDESVVAYEAYQAYEAFKRYKRPENVSISE